MKSAKKPKSEDELEDTPSKETLERWRDRKLKDDITNMMYRMEMESIKPGFDVLLQTGTHRGHYGRKFNKKRRPQTSEGLHEGVEKAGHSGHGRSHSAGKDDAAESRRFEDWHDARLSAIHEDSDKRKTYDRQQDRADRWMSEFRELSPARHHKTQETGGGHSRVAGGIRSRTHDDASPSSSLSGMVMRASRLTTDNLDDASPSWSAHATLRRSGDYRHFPGAAVISVDELPRPQRHTYLLQETQKTLDAEAASPGSSLSGMVMRASRLSTDDLNDASPSWSTHATPRRSSDYRHPPGTAVISVEELPRPQRGTYLVQETERTLDAEGADRAWSGSVSQPYSRRRSSAQSDAGVRPISLHGDDLMAYVHDTESIPGDFTLNAILARQEESKRQQPRLQSVSASTWNEYTAAHDIGKLYRLLDNPFTAHEYERTIPKQQITFSDNYTSLPYTPETIITSPTLRYT